MPLEHLENALKEFGLALDDLTNCFEFVRAATRLRPRLNEMLRWESMDAQAKALVGTFLKQGGVQESILYRGMVISLTGAFEQLVRRIMRDSVIAINRSALHYDALQDGLKRQNIYRTGLAFQTVFEPPDYLVLDYELLAKNIGTCFAGSKEPILNADAFTIFLSVIPPDRLTRTFEYIGITLQWDLLGKVPELRDAVDRKDTRETAKALQEFLKRFGQIRNKIAHSGSSGVLVSESDFEQFLLFFRAFGRALASAVEAQLVKLLAK